ncbi:MAG: acyl carrier protein [Hydrogenophaga sp.]|jgi:acyl carrier protein
MKTTFQRLQAIVAKDHKLDIETITADSSLESLGIDSLGVAELLFNIEDEFRVTLPVEPVHDLATVGDVARFIDTLIAAQPAPSADAALVSPTGSGPLT